MPKYIKFVQGEQFMYERFRQLMEERGITSYRVSKDTGVSEASLSEWKRGNSTPKVENLKKIANYFNVTLDYLLGEVDIYNGIAKNKKTPEPKFEGVIVALLQS
jgi:transcriptional regulator with XRE-family HTH domain